MKKKKRNYLIIALVTILLITITAIIVMIFNDESRLTTLEKEWVTENENSVLNINTFNNIDIVGDSGSGIIYDFIDDFKSEYNLQLNPVAYNETELNIEVGFTIKEKPSNDDLIFYEGHYVIISKNNTNIDSLEELNNMNVGTLINNQDRVREYLGTSINVTGYTTFEELLTAFNDTSIITNYIIIPQEQYLTEILTNDLYIVKHLSDLKNYYVYNMPEEEEYFSNVIYRFYQNWSKDKLTSSELSNTLNVFTKGLNITSKELSDMQSKEHNYGFIENKPYDVLAGGNYGGIISEYLRYFTNMSEIDFKFIKYDNIEELKNAVNNNEINAYTNFYQFDTNFINVSIPETQEYVIISNKENNDNFNTLNGLSNKTVYVLKDSLIYEELKNNKEIEIVTYDSEKSLQKAIKENNFIAIDKNSFAYYQDNILRDHTIRYTAQLTNNYSLSVNDSEAFNKLFEKYIMTLDYNNIKTQGIYSNEITITNGNTFANIAKYTLLTFAILLLIGYAVYRSGKKINITKKIKKDDKVKFIDQLTSLKNRNYLKEHIDSWNKNTIYPQATIIIDLNQLQIINDTLGYEHGDKQIKAAANVLIKTQLDSSEIIRTDGNEYLIYLVGYSERQIVSYTKKLQKEFKSLPYEHGAAIGYSMITDDIKTIEDAINESVEIMKAKKEELKEEMQ